MEQPAKCTDKRVAVDLYKGITSIHTYQIADFWSLLYIECIADCVARLSDAFAAELGKGSLAL